jgi:hypothetical protein
MAFAHSVYGWLDIQFNKAIRDAGDPNQIAASHFRKDVLVQFSPQADISTAFRNLAKIGEVKNFLSAYQEIAKRTVYSYKEFNWTEVDYRDKICGTLTLSRQCLGFKSGGLCTHLEAQ